MAVTTTKSRISHVGDGTSTVFTIDFYFLLATDIAVFVGGNKILTGYTVQGAGNPAGGSVTFLTPPLATTPIDLIRDPDQLQNTRFPPNDPFPSAASETGLDKLTMLIQRLFDRLSRVLQFPDTEVGFSGVLPPASERAGKLHGYDALGAIVMVPPTADIGAGNRIPFQFVSGVDFAPGATQLTLPTAPGAPGNLEIFFDAYPRDFSQWSVNVNIVTFASPIPTYITKVWGYIGTTLSLEIPPDNSVVDGKIIWYGSLRKLASSVAELRTLSGSRYSHVETVGYYAGTFVGGGLYARDGTDTTSADNGGTVIVGSDGTRWKLQYQNSVCVTQFGAKPSRDGSTVPTFDSSSAFNALMADACAKVYTADFGSGMYYAPQIRTTAGRLHIIGSCEISGATSGSFDYQFEIKNAVDLRIDGRILFAGRYNAGYASGVKVWADTGVLSLVFINGVSFSGHRNAWQFGDPSQPDKQVSEITIRDGYTFGCPIAYSTYGTQTFVGFSGYQLRSSYGSGTGTWLSLPTRVGLQLGGHVTISSDTEILMTEVTAGAGFELDAILSPGFGNQYGTIKAVGCVMECAATFVITGNPAGVSSPQGGLIHLDVTGIHTQNAGALIQTDASFAGNIVVPDTANIYATTPRSFANVACSGPAHVYVGDKAFGKNCLQGLGGISGGIAHFSERVIARVSNLGGATIPAGTTTLLWQSADNTGNLARQTVSYNPLTGTATFTQPVKKVRVVGGFFHATIYGTSALLTKLNQGGVSTRGIQLVNSAICANIGDVNAGDFVFIDCNNTGPSVASGSNAYDFFEIIGYN